ncbi:hypothetical protein D9M71_682160 [compost metagenome]
MFVAWTDESAEHIANSSDVFDFKKLYASKPAPVSALPERMIDFPNYDKLIAQGWNACLDKVKELNQ